MKYTSNIMNIVVDSKCNFHSHPVSSDVLSDSFEYHHLVELSLYNTLYENP